MVLNIRDQLYNELEGIQQPFTGGYVTSSSISYKSNTFYVKKVEMKCPGTERCMVFYHHV